MCTLPRYERLVLQCMKVRFIGTDMQSDMYNSEDIL